MTKTQPLRREIGSTVSPAMLPASWYYLVFFAAGMPAMLYQVAWQRVLALYFGVDIYSTSVTVGSFMLGLGLGSLIGGRIADRAARPAFYYLAVEALIGCFGLLSVSLFSGVGRLLGGCPLWVMVPLNFMLLLVPTTLMGMTLPLMCQMVKVRNQTIGRHLSRLYSVNTLGAALGALITAYLLLGFFGIDRAIYLAASMNFVLAFATLLIATRGVPEGDTQAAKDPRPEKANGRFRPRGRLRYSTLLVLSFLSGLVALGYEIVWYRILGCLLHGTVYVFGTILGVYLLGIAWGSFLSRKRIDRENPARRFAFSQLGIAVYTLLLFTILGHFSWLPGIRHVLAASTYTSFHPSPELLSGHVNLVTMYSLLDIPFWTLLLTGIPTILMGYGFPNLMRAASQSVEHLGKSVGRIYFANILGATAGTLLVGFATIHYFGTEASLLLMLLLGCVPAVMVFGWAVDLRQLAAGRGVWGWASLAGAAAALLFAVVVFPRRGELIRAVHYADFGEVQYVAASEDRSGVVVLKKQCAVISFPEERRAIGTYRLCIDGANHGGFRDLETPSEDEWARWALSAHRAPRRVLSIGLGNGQMCLAAANWPKVQQLVIVELNAALARVLQHTANGRLLSGSPKVRLIVDDGRRWLLANRDAKFDAILMFPLHAAHAHSGSLFSLEFFNLVKQHLHEEGILFLRSVDCYATAKTLAISFPHVARAHRVCYVASRKVLRFDLDVLGWSRQEFLDQVDADRSTILQHTADAPLNRDLRPNSEFYLTYRYRRCLQTSNAGPAYAVQDRFQVADMIRHSNPPSRLSLLAAPSVQEELPLQEQTPRRLPPRHGTVAPAVYVEPIEGSRRGH